MKFTDIQIKLAFKRVKNQRDWKSPILAVIKEEDKELVAEAIRTETKSEPWFSPFPGRPGTLWVQALGYRLSGPKAA